MQSTTTTEKPGTSMTMIGGNITREWADLPRELLESISKRLVLADSPIDLLRFRSVCNSWRSSSLTPLLDQITPRPPPSFNLPFTGHPRAILLPTQICLLRLQPQLPCNGINTTTSSSGRRERGWLAKVGLSPLGKFQLFHPLSNHRLLFSPIKLDLSNVRFLRLCNSSSLCYRHSRGLPLVGVHKAVLFPISASCKGTDFGIIAIYLKGKLGYLKFGEKRWTLLDAGNFMYDDIIEYKGHYYVVDRWGTVSWIDSSLKVHQYSPPLYGCGAQKNLVESCGDLFVVDRFLDGKRTWNDEDGIVFTHNRNRNRENRKPDPRTVDFRVHKLDEEWGTWVDVKSLGNRVFFLCHDCSFSASADDLVGGIGNCIYFVEGDNYKSGGLSSECIRVFQLEDGTIESLALRPPYSDVFWPPSHHQTPNYLRSGC